MSLKERIKNIGWRWSELRKSSDYRNIGLFLVFVVIATLFWLLMALNDNVQNNVEVKLRIYNVPDSVTFINDPPSEIYVDVRDKGTQLMRNFWRGAEMQLNFKEFATSGVFRVNSTAFYSALRKEFGSNAQISTSSIDSLHLEYTGLPGKMVPIEVSYDIHAASGSVLASAPQPETQHAMVYSRAEVLDTIRYVTTRRISMADLTSSVVTTVGIQPITGAKIVPAQVSVTIPIEKMVSKNLKVSVTVKNVPKDVDVLLFPDKVSVSYFTPMSKFNEADSGISVYVDYDEIRHLSGTKAGLHLGQAPREVSNLTLMTDSVEYTVIR